MTIFGFTDRYSSDFIEQCRREHSAIESEPLTDNLPNDRSLFGGDHFLSLFPLQCLHCQGGGQ